MSLLTTYTDFLARVDELGFMPLSYLLPGLPYLGEETPGHLWHTGDPDTDPWQWKDRAAQEKRAAYGCILGGHKGFIAARLYPVFYAACRPVEPMPERWAAGTIDQASWMLWQLFEKKRLLNTSEVRREMGVTHKSGGSRLDACLQRLQREFYLTTAGVRRKVAKDGQPYGWAATVYDRVSCWASPEWLSEAASYEPRGARGIILDIGMEIGRNVDRAALAEKLEFI